MTTKSIIITKIKNLFKKEKSVEKKFEEIFYKNSWNGKESVSGTGSDFDQTKTLILEIPKLLHEFKISTILDVPCGDFNWMKEIDLNNYQYFGADIVNDLVLRNKELYQTENITFQKLNLLEDALPSVSLVLVRDCLVHFSFSDIYSALSNIAQSKSEYFLTTTFTDVNSNHDIITGDWRPLNLCIKPFNFPQPIVVINENCTELNMTCVDKSLGLWKMADIVHLMKK